MFARTLLLVLPSHAIAPPLVAVPPPPLSLHVFKTALVAPTSSSAMHVIVLLFIFKSVVALNVTLPVPTSLLLATAAPVIPRPTIMNGLDKRPGEDKLGLTLGINLVFSTTTTFESGAFNVKNTP